MELYRRRGKQASIEARDDARGYTAPLLQSNMAHGKTGENFTCHSFGI
jgi:hypothetical protein